MVQRSSPHYGEEALTLITSEALDWSKYLDSYTDTVSGNPEYQTKLCVMCAVLRKIWKEINKDQRDDFGLPAAWLTTAANQNQLTSVLSVHTKPSTCPDLGLLLH